MVSKEDFSKLIDRLDQFESNFNTRLSAIESSGLQKSNTATAHAVQSGQAGQPVTGGAGQQNGGAAADQSGLNVSEAPANSDFVHFPSEKLLQEQFKTIKDTLSKVKLPLGFKTDFSLRGVGRNQTSSAKIINNCCEYSETLMKYVLCLQSGDPIQEDNINTLMNILAAQIKYLQSEKAICFVNGKFGENVGTLFREFKSHTSVFSPEDVQVLEHVAQLANSQRGRGRGNRGGYRNTNRDGYNPGASGGNRYNWRGGFNNRRSNFNNRGDSGAGAGSQINDDP